MTYALWVVQGLLALLFLWAGGIKLVLPLEELTGPVPIPGLFLRFIGVAEVLGALGLILPGLLRIRPGLTPLAATGLVDHHDRGDRDHAGGGGPRGAADTAGGGAPRGPRRLCPLAARAASRAVSPDRVRARPLGRR
jgi:hypothetical protein